jgi:hypothetical protein
LNFYSGGIGAPEQNSWQSSRAVDSSFTGNLRLQKKHDTQVVSSGQYGKMPALAFIRILKYLNLQLIYPIPELVVLSVRNTHRLISFTHVTKSIPADQFSDFSLIRPPSWH